MFKKAKKEVAETQLMLGGEDKTEADRVEPLAAPPKTPKRKRRD